MNRRKFLMQIAVGAVLTPAFAAPARAESVTDQVVQQLQSQGYGKIEVSRTLLGRIRIVATRSDFRREIVIDRRTGEVLRDLLQPLPSRRNGENSVQIRDDNIGSGNSNYGSSSSGGDDGGDKDDSESDNKGEDHGDDDHGDDDHGDTHD